jgi:hypothetical protein
MTITTENFARGFPECMAPDPKAFPELQVAVRQAMDESNAAVAAFNLVPTNQAAADDLLKAIAKTNAAVAAFNNQMIFR